MSRFHVNALALRSLGAGDLFHLVAVAFLRDLLLRPSAFEESKCHLPRGKRRWVPKRPLSTVALRPCGVWATGLGRALRTHIRVHIPFHGDGMYIHCTCVFSARRETPTHDALEVYQ